MISGPRWVPCEGGGVDAKGVDVEGGEPKMGKRGGASALAAPFGGRGISTAGTRFNVLSR